MNEEIKEILGRVEEAVKALENVEDSKKDIFEDIGVLVLDAAQVVFAEDKETKVAEKKDAINTIASILTELNSL